jgi:hypothetical protein
MKKKVQAIFLKIQRWSSFSPKNRAQIDQKSFLDRAPRMEQQKQKRCASGRPWQRAVWPYTTTNQQSGSTSLSHTMPDS